MSNLNLLQQTFSSKDQVKSKRMNQTLNSTLGWTAAFVFMQRIHFLHAVSCMNYSTNSSSVPNKDNMQVKASFLSVSPLSFLLTE